MTERHTAPHRSFAEFFAAEIAPGLPALETQRRDRRRNAYTRLLVAAFVVVVTALIVGMAWHALAGGAVLIVGVVVGFIWARLPARRQRDAVRAHVVPARCRFLDTAAYPPVPGARFDLPTTPRTRLAAPL